MKKILVKSADSILKPKIVPKEKVNSKSVAKKTHAAKTGSPNVKAIAKRTKVKPPVASSEYAKYAEKTKIFIERALSVHGSKYDYSECICVDSLTKVRIRCPIHGIFETLPSNHISGKSGCSKCSKGLKKTTEQYITEARAKHGDRYDYSECIFTGAKEKVTVKCPTHGKFRQIASIHIKSGCPKCSRRKGTAKFIEEATKLHAQLYDYSKVQYERTDIKVKIICRRCKETFDQSPSHHLQGYGCSNCGGSKKKDTPTFIAEAKKKHGNRYIYDLVKYVSTSTDVDIICRIHGKFSQWPVRHLKGQGCPHCGKGTLTTELFVKQARLKHGKRYNYDSVQYTTAGKKVAIGCYIHGVFKQKPCLHLSGQGCPKCIGRHRTVEEFIAEARRHHGSYYDYSKVKFKKLADRITIICPCHGEFTQTAFKHMNGQGCVACARIFYSKVSIGWLNYRALQLGATIQHAENGGEHMIDGTRYRADGYSKELNKVFEFHGTYFHGHPDFYDPDDKLYTGKTFGEAYQQTLNKEKLIIEKGYDYECMWEHEWHLTLSAIVKIQRAWRARRKHVEYVTKYVLVFPPKKTK